MPVISKNICIFVKEANTLGYPTYLAKQNLFDMTNEYYEIERGIIFEEVVYSQEDIEAALQEIEE